MKNLYFYQLNLLLLKARVEELPMMYNLPNEHKSNRTLIENYTINSDDHTLTIKSSDDNILEVHNIKEVDYNAYDDKVEILVSGDANIRFEIIVPHCELVDNIF